MECVWIPKNRSIFSILLKYWIVIYKINEPIANLLYTKHNIMYFDKENRLMKRNICVAIHRILNI